MQNRGAKTVTQAIRIFALGIFLFTSVFGLGAHALGMEMGEGGTMLGCLFMGETAMCQMNLFEHLSLWQNTFIAVLSVSASLVLLLVIVGFIFSYLDRHRLQQAVLSQPLRASIASEVSLADYLRQAFSQGILHPKIY